jgi:predicted DNA-binding protein
MNKVHIKDKQVFLISLDKETKDKLQEEAKEKGMTLTGYIREIIKNRK